MIRIISDLHYRYHGSKCRDWEQLEPLIHGCDHLVLNGDTLEQRRRKPEVQRREREALMAFLARFPKLKVTFVTGNHDPLISEVHSVSLGDAVVTHGDLFMRPHGGPLNHGLQQLQERRLRRLRKDAAPAGSSWYHVTRSAWLLWSRFRAGSNAHKWAVSEQVPLLVVGHTHRPSERWARRVWNTGSYGVFGRPRCVELDHGRATLRIVRTAGRGGAFHLGRTLASCHWSKTGPSQKTSGGGS